MAHITDALNRNANRVAHSSLNFSSLQYSIQKYYKGDNSNLCSFLLLILGHLPTQIKNSLSIYTGCPVSKKKTMEMGCIGQNKNKI